MENYNYNEIKHTFDILDADGKFDHPLIGSDIYDLKKDYPDLMNYANFLKEKFNLVRITEALYWIKHNITEYPKCQYHTHEKCDDKPKFINYFEGYRKGCKYCGRKNPDIFQKQKDGMIKKYGTDNIFKVDGYIEKHHQYMKETYGGYGWASPIFNEKFKKAMMEKYGVDNASKNKDLLKKSMENKAIYVAEHKDEMVAKKQQTEIEKYGSLFCQTEEYKTKHAEYMDSKPEYRQYAISKKQELINEWNVELLEDIHWGKDLYPFKCLHCGTVYNDKGHMLSLKGVRDGKAYWCNKCYPVSGGKSRPEYELKIFFQKTFGDNFNIIHGSRSIIPNVQKELDLYFPDYNVAIEYCGTIYHANKGYGYQNGGYDPEYHQNKFELCLKNNIKLITVFEAEWFHSIQRTAIKQRILRLFGKYTNMSITNMIDCDVLTVNKFLNNNVYFTQFLNDNTKCKVLMSNDTQIGVLIQLEDKNYIIYYKNDVIIDNLSNFLKSNNINCIVTDNRYPIQYSNLTSYKNSITWEAFKGFSDRIYKDYPEKNNKQYVQINDCGYSLIQL